MTLLIANWKMNGSRARVRAYAYSLNAALADMPGSVRAVFCPPTAYISAAVEALPQNAQLKIGAQNCHAHASGAFTGEVSAAMLADVGARYVILGHSERRSDCHETCEEVQAKAQIAIASGLIPIICIGESRAKYEAGQTASVLGAQAALLAGFSPGTYVVAYEPLWAIGSGKTPSMAEIASAHRVIKSALGSETSVLYGGSVNAGNIKEILGIADVQGALIGGASLEIDSMRALLNEAA